MPCSYLIYSPLLNTTVNEAKTQLLAYLVAKPCRSLQYARSNLIGRFWRKLGVTPLERCLPVRCANAHLHLSHLGGRHRTLSTCISRVRCLWVLSYCEFVDTLWWKISLRIHIPNFPLMSLASNTGFSAWSPNSIWGAFSMTFKDLRNLCTQILTFCSCSSDGFRKTGPCHFASTTKLTDQQRQCHPQVSPKKKYKVRSLCSSRVLAILLKDSSNPRGITWL